ncbi:MAG: putative Small GTP-binding domain protein, Arf-domain signature [Promethearchaeota archaeon]|nr:MAG: putative Small GTP-binding domain protein, Arf-domain signature [Candidatus Lokiarchaeota archaeon]
MFREQGLCIVYFDSIIGPNIFYCNHELSENDDFPDLGRILEFSDDPGTFIYAFKDYQTINHTFYLPSTFARGRKEIIMISYFIHAASFSNEISDIFHYLQSKSPILKKLAKKLLSLPGFPKVIHSNVNKHLKGNVLTLGDPNFQSTFLLIFNYFYKKLSAYNRGGLIQSDDVIKKVFIFGPSDVGKTTFLKHIEKVHSQLQNANDLPTKIFQVVIDNLEILTEKCTDTDLKCEQCERNNRCINNAEGFILIFDVSNKESVIDAKERFKIIVSKFCQKKPYTKIPFLIIGNKFKYHEDVAPEGVYKTFGTEQAEKCAIDMRYFSMNLLTENGKILDALRWLIKKIL